MLHGHMTVKSSRDRDRCARALHGIRFNLMDAEVEFTMRAMTVASPTDADGTDLARFKLSGLIVTTDSTEVDWSWISGKNILTALRVAYNFRDTRPWMLSTTRHITRD